MPGETAEQVSGWTIDTAMAHMQTQHNNLVALLNERALAINGSRPLTSSGRPCRIRRPRSPRESSMTR
jgi:hypothetical protein